MTKCDHHELQYVGLNWYYCLACRLMFHRVLNDRKAYELVETDKYLEGEVNAKTT